MRTVKLENHLLSILESMHDAVLVISKDSTIVYVNTAYSVQFGVPVHKIIGKKLSKVEPKARILEVLKTGQPLINDYSYLDSLNIHIFANMTPLIEKGELIGAVAIMKDISEFYALQEELQRYKTYSTQLEKQLNQKIFSLLESHAPGMRQAVEMAKKVADSEATVLLFGETGVGKEVFARAIHEASPRGDKPFVAINMASLPESLFESELFGFEEGAFTGSRKGGKRGLFELANGGTLFLDEIGELSLFLQAKLLRVLQERAFIKVGGTTIYPLDIRIIAATNRDLQKLMREGKFRQDLYYRLNIVPIHIPPVRERKQDLPILMNNILSELKSKYRKQVTVTQEVYEIFERYDWPGNVRELSNVLERMIAVCSKSYFVPEDVPPFVREGSVLSESPIEPSRQYASGTNALNLPALIEKTEKEMLEEVLRTSRTRTEAIRRLGISRKTFYQRLKKYNIQ
ncbi:sigma 54-interacting transcriptional regulator [Aneurinibacillus thermoaerophilus]|uniref:sigma-54 interaction domain-containing protein n=1 Tax=Aneurinibacillus thermoaerophilus TaxID=143495 RepID=UPI001FE2F083|nr:sigma 54-interacting transcriptional regulator [Aneurinibacillus thermoaerophilus]MED0676289.1 sigma 54-interacting transcriptional regulator [Aneurinibacillus thermoaerophilus]MED0759544.1 sigma 54-interacting transcriptional regulator [Aneurinibacillus thermoaerophilus]